MKKTPWFPGHVLPVRDGVYERYYTFSKPKTRIVFCKFKDGKWFCSRDSAHLASLEYITSFVGNAPWRGLTKKAAA